MDTILLIVLFLVGTTILPVIPFAVLDAIWEFRQKMKEEQK